MAFFFKLFNKFMLNRTKLYHADVHFILMILYTVHTAFSGTAFSGQTAFSRQVFAPLKNPLIAVAEGFRKNLKKFFFKLRNTRFHGLFCGRKSCD